MTKFDDFSLFRKFLEKEVWAIGKCRFQQSIKQFLMYQGEKIGYRVMSGRVTRSVLI